MGAVYPKIRTVARSFLALSVVVLLAGCGGGGPSGYAPWNFNTGVVTKDPESMPDIAWQTQNQRAVLNRESEAFARQQTAAETKIPEVRQETPVPAAPILKAPRKARVALLVPLSGKNAEMGQAMLNAAQMALFDVGSAGVSLVPADTKGTPAGAAAAAKEAIADGADIILGPVFSEDLKIVKPVAAAQNVPVVSFSTDWVQAGNGTYLLGFMPFAQVARVAQYAQSRGYSRVAVYAPQTEYCDVVISTLSRAGVQPVRVERYSPQQTDLSALVKDFAETSGAARGAPSFDALLLPVGGESLRTLISLLDAAGVKGARLLGTGLWDDASLSNNPALYGGWYAAPDPRLRVDFEKRYEDNYGTRPQRLASLAYDATALAAVLAHAGGGYTREALTNPRGFAGIDGIFRFRQDGLAERGLAVLEIQSGKPKIVDPAPTAFIASGS